jgi:hypothetical protein
VHSLAQVEVKVLCRATAKAVEGDGSHGPSHERRTYARSEPVN